MNDFAPTRVSHPCIARRCGHPQAAHVHTPELQAIGETVLWCAHCRRHEVRVQRRLWAGRRSVPMTARALPLAAV